jgi:hypothetical protein
MISKTLEWSDIPLMDFKEMSLKIRWDVYPGVGDRSFSEMTLVIDGWRVVDDDDDNNQSVGEPQAEGMMSTAARLFPQLETKVDRSGEEQTND